jgi:hypothetical protein
LSAPAGTAGQPLGLKSLTTSAGQYALVEFRIEGLPDYANSFDPAEVDSSSQAPTAS